MAAPSNAAISRVKAVISLREIPPRKRKPAGHGLPQCILLHREHVLLRGGFDLGRRVAMEDQLAEFTIDRQQLENSDTAAVTGAPAFLAAGAAMISALDKRNTHGFELLADGGSHLRFHFAIVTNAAHQPLREDAFER